MSNLSRIYDFKKITKRSHRRLDSCENNAHAPWKSGEVREDPLWLDGIHKECYKILHDCCDCLFAYATRRSERWWEAPVRPFNFTNRWNDYPRGRYPWWLVNRRRVIATDIDRNVLAIMIVSWIFSIDTECGMYEWYWTYALFKFWRVLGLLKLTCRDNLDKKLGYPKLMSRTIVRASIPCATSMRLS